MRDAGQDHHSKQMTPNECTCDSCATLGKMYMVELVLKKKEKERKTPVSSHTDIGG